MSYYRICPHCGANLDPGEVCDCWDEKTPVGASDTDEGKVEKVLPDSDSASILPHGQEENQAWKTTKDLTGC